MYKYLLYFLIFSFLGWCAEVTFYIFKTGSLVNRGLAKGPFCPIYGVGISLCYLTLGWIDSFVLLALFSMAMSTAIEFFVGVFLGHTLGERLWDYSSEKGNIFGYVCPRFSLIWGLVSAVTIRLIPRLDPLISYLDSPVWYAVSFVLLTSIIVDVKIEMLKRQKSKLAPEYVNK
jgi:uncharacterized membrane protein